MKIALIGLGRMGIAQSRLARFFKDSILFGVDISQPACDWFGREFHVPTVTNVQDPSIAAFFAELDLLWLTVTDDAIASVAAQLTNIVSPTTVVLHTSGSLSSAILTPYLPHHAHASLHPPLSCPIRDVTDLACFEHFHGVLHTFDGTESAWSCVKKLTDRLDSSLVRIDPSQKVLYHAAAVFASNYPITLLSISEHLFERCGFEPELALESARRLLKQSVQTAQVAPPIDALTGPVKRHDTSTLEQHRLALASDPELLRLYNALCLETQKLAQWNE